MNPIHATLVYLLWGVITFFFMVCMLTFLKNRKALYSEPGCGRVHESKFPMNSKKKPRISIIVPAFNEEEGISATIESLHAIEYPRDLLEIIVVNDGSKDKTGEIAREYAKRGDIVLIDNKKNKGKAAALNEGIKKANGEFIGCIDADTIVSPDAIKKTLGYFNEKNVGAVIVRVRVRDPKNWLERIIEVEYNLGLGFYPKLFSFLDCLYLTPGQFSMYRASVLLELNGFDVNNIVEDTEIAYRIQKAGYKIKCSLSTWAYTIVPDNLRALYFQRKRWYSGTIQTLMQHRDVFFNRRLGNFGVFFIPINYLSTFLGTLLFLSTIHLAVSGTVSTISNFSLIEYDVYTVLSNFFEHSLIDPLSVSIFVFFGVTPFLMNAIACYVGLKSIGERVRDNPFGFVCFLFFFIPYHIFWLISLYFVVFKKEIKWRESM